MFRPLFAAGLAQQPIAQCPKRAGQRQVTPKSDPGFGAVEAMRQPLDVLMISEAQFVWMPGGARVESADQAITEEGNGQNSQGRDGIWDMGWGLPSSIFRDGSL